jgi:hypothetical protein
VTAYAKAIIAALIAGLGSVAAALDDGHLSGQEIVTAVLVLVVAFGGVYGVPNKAQGQ